jgi:hypothetical protein
MATVNSNKSISSASVSNLSFGVTWGATNFNWGDNQGTWGNEATISNKSISSASITNKTI